MVRVLKCHGFKSQSVLPTEAEPCAIFVSEGEVFVATRACSLEIFSLRFDGCQRIYWFPSESVVKHITCNRLENYVATIECKKTRKSDIYSVKVYLNWQQQYEATKNTIKLRISGKSPGAKYIPAQSSHFDVICIPSDDRINSISCCESTGNLAVGFSKSVQIFQCIEVSVLNYTKTYRDVVKFLELTWPFKIQNISLCENYLACISTRDAHVVEILYTNNRDTRLEQRGEDTKTSERVNPPWNPASFEEASHFRSDNLKNVVSAGPGFSGFQKYSNAGYSPSISVGSGVQQDGLSSRMEFADSVINDAYYMEWSFDVDKSGSTRGHQENVVKDAIEQQKMIMLPSMRSKQLPNLPVLKDFRGRGFASLGSVNVSSVFHKVLRMRNDTWREVSLVPTYLTDGSRRKPLQTKDNPILSDRYDSLIGMSCFISGSQNGTLYNVLQKTECLATYNYTTNSSQAAVTPYLVYAVTETGLEVYTSRSRIAALYSREKPDNFKSICPDPALDICMCGIHPFIGAKQLSVSDDHVVIFSKDDSTGGDEESAWSLYVLKNNPVSELYAEMVSYGLRYKKASPNVCHHMLQEGHMLLASNMGTTACSEDLQTLFKESCSLLADYYAAPGCDQYTFALPYYLMSGRAIEDIITQAIQYRANEKQTTPYAYGQGLLYYLNYVLFEDDVECDIAQICSDQILDIYFEMEPESMSRLILFSKLQNYTADKALDRLQQCIEHQDVSKESKGYLDYMYIAEGVLHLKLCDPDSAHIAFSKVKEKEFVEAIAQNHHLLHKDFIELSPLAQLLRKHFPNMFIQILVHLHDEGNISLDSAVNLLQGTSSATEIHKNNHVKEYLEALCNDSKRSYIFNELFHTLCDIYIKRLTDWKETTYRQYSNTQKQHHVFKKKGLFAPRYSWLDSLPPFSGLGSLRQPCKYIVRSSPRNQRRLSLPSITLSTASDLEEEKKLCTCAMCNEDLIKLQDWVKAVDLFLDKYPKFLADFGMSVFNGDAEKWRYIISSLVAKLRMSAEMKSDKETSYSDALIGVLKVVSEFLSPDLLMDMLPPDGNFLFFLPYILNSFKTTRGRELKETIISRGQDILNSLDQNC